MSTSLEPTADSVKEAKAAVTAFAITAFATMAFETTSVIAETLNHDGLNSTRDHAPSAAPARIAATIASKLDILVMNALRKSGQIINGAEEAELDLESSEKGNKGKNLTTLQSNGIHTLLSVPAILHHPQPIHMNG
jgi:hypothetical protein